MTHHSRSLDIVRKFYPGVREVRDATEPLTIEVTKKDAQSRAVKDHRECAAAVACKRQMKVEGVIISRAIAYLVKRNVATRYEVPDSLSREVIAFDRGGAFEPGTYRLKRPFKGVRLGATRKHRRTLSKKGPGALRHVTTNVRAGLGGE